MEILFTLRNLPNKYFCVSFYWRCPFWGLNRGLTSNKPTQYLLDYADYMLGQVRLENVYLSTETSTVPGPIEGRKDKRGGRKKKAEEVGMGSGLLTQKKENKKGRTRLH